MINPIVSVNAKSLLAVEMIINSTIGEPIKFLISEGVKVTNLKYLEDGKEILVSGLVKVIKWNYIKLPENEVNCVHDTTSTFARQCQPKSFIVDCSKDFESDVREIPVLAVRGCEAVEDGTSEEPVVARPKVSRVYIDGVVDEQTGALTDVNVVLVLDKEIAEDALEEFVEGTRLTITDTPIQDAALSSFEITVDEKGSAFTLAVSDEFSLEKLSAGDMAVVQSEDGTDIYTLSEKDIPAWVKPVIEFTLSSVAVDDAAGTVSFTVNGATVEEDPIVVVLNETDVVSVDTEDVVVNEIVTGRLCQISIDQCSLYSTGNVLKVVGPGYTLETEMFDGPAAAMVDAADGPAQISGGYENIKTAIANDTVDDMVGQFFIKVLTGVPADQVVTGVRINGKTYGNDDDVRWMIGDTLYTSVAVMEIDSDVYVNLIPVINTTAETTDITVVTNSVLSNGMNKAVEYPTAIVVLPKTKLGISSDGVVGTMDGYLAEGDYENGSLTITRENAGVQMALIPNANGAAIPNGELIMVSYKEGTEDDIAVLSLFNGHILLPLVDADTRANTEAVTTTATATIFALESGAMEVIDIKVDDVTRPVLAVNNMRIDGDIDFDGMIKNPVISFGVSRDIDKNTLANASLSIYGTTVMNKKIGILTTNINIVDKEVTVTFPDTTELNASEIKHGTVATLTIGDETAVAEVSVPTYVPPVFRGAAITGTPDFKTGIIADGKLVLTFNETVPHGNLKVSIGDVAEINVASASNVVNENGVITIPLANANAADYQDFAKMDVVVSRGNESFRAVMTRGTHYPVWESAPVLQRVEVVGTPDVDTGLIANPVVKVTLDKTTNLTGATVKIIALGIDDLPLTDSNAVTVDNTVSITLSESLSMATAPAEGVTAVMTNGGYTQDFVMTVGDDYPEWSLPLKLLKVQITDDANPADPTETVALATITMTFNQEADLSDLTSLVVTDVVDEDNETEIANVTLSGLTTDENGVATTSATNLNMNITGVLKAVVSGESHTFVYELTEDDYPKYTGENG